VARTVELTPKKAIAGAVHVTLLSPVDDFASDDVTATAIDGWLFKPRGEGPFPAVVAAHGCGGLVDKDGTLASNPRAWADRLVGEGYVVLFPDSFTARGFVETCTHESRSLRPGYERARDNYAALQYLQHQPFVQADHVGLLGWSSGATSVLSVVDTHARARPADLVHDFRTAVAFYPSCKAAQQSHSWHPALSLHVLVGQKDDGSPAQECVDLGAQSKANGGDVDVTVYKGAYQGFDDAHLGKPSKVRTASTKSGQVTLAGDPVARKDALARTSKVLADALAPQAIAHTDSVKNAPAAKSSTSRSAPAAKTASKSAPAKGSTKSASKAGTQTAQR
jgi:dienelactone hydrolase